MIEIIEIIISASVIIAASIRIAIKGSLENLALGARLSYLVYYNIKSASSSSNSKLYIVLYKDP